MTIRSRCSLLLIAFLAPLALKGAPAVHFEPAGSYFVTSGGNFDARVEPNRLRLMIGGKESEIRWIGSGAARLSGDDATGGNSNYYSGPDPARSRVNVPHFGAVRAAGLYPGVDARIRTRGRDIEFDVLLDPGADLNQVRFEASSEASITGEGDLQIASGGPRLRRPEVWQTVKGEKRAVECRFERSADGVISFRAGAYDRSLPLVIDPVVEYATYLGGNGTDVIQSVAVDPSGNAIVAGYSTSTNFPGASFGSPTAFTS